MAVVRVEVSGVVQGVGFRWFAKESARRVGLAGWVRNREDGSVEIAVSGNESAVAQFLVEIGRGPRGAVVERVRHLPVDQLEPLPHPFTIQR